MGNNIDDLIEKIKNNSREENQELAQELKKGLSNSQSDALNKLLSNKELMQKLLNSDEAKNIMNKLGGDKRGHQ